MVVGEGAPIPNVGAPTSLLFWVFFPENCIKLKNIEPRDGRMFVTLPLDPNNPKNLVLNTAMLHVIHCPFHVPDTVDLTKRKLKFADFGFIVVVH